MDLNLVYINLKVLQGRFLNRVRGGVQTTITTTIIAILVAEVPGKTHFPTMLSGGVQGQEKRRPKHKCCGKN